MTGLARRGGRSRVSATPGRSPQRSRQRVARGLVVVEDACRTTAAQVARQVARGDTASAWQAESNAPTGAKVSTTTSGGWVNVTVEVDRSLGRIGPVHLRGQARSPMEPGQT